MLFGAGFTCPQWESREHIGGHRKGKSRNVIQAGHTHSAVLKSLELCDAPTPPPLCTPFLPNSGTGWVGSQGQDVTHCPACWLPASPPAQNYPGGCRDRGGHWVLRCSWASACSCLCSFGLHHFLQLPEVLKANVSLVAHLLDDLTVAVASGIWRPEPQSHTHCTIHRKLSKLWPAGHLWPTKDIYLDCHLFLLLLPVLLNCWLGPASSAHVWHVHLTLWLPPLCLMILPLCLRQGSSNYSPPKEGPSFPLKYW